MFGSSIPPMTGRITDAHEKQAVGLASQFERFWRPELPGSWVVNVRANIRALTLAASVREGQGAIESGRARHASKASAI